MLKLPKDLFRKSVVTISNDENNNIMRQNLIGYVAKDTEEVIVVFSEFNGNLRFDIPKSIVSVAGNSVIIDSRESLSKYEVKREAPLPQGKSSSLSAEEISGTIARVTEPERLKVEINDQPPSHIEPRKLYKTPVQAPILPTIETSDNRVETSEEKSINHRSQPPIDSIEVTVVETVKRQNIKSHETEPSNYQTQVSVKNLDMTESIHEKEGHTKSGTNMVASTSTTPIVVEENVTETEKKTKAHELLSHDKAVTSVPVEEPPSTQPEQTEKEIITLPRVDKQPVSEPVEKLGLVGKEEQPQELHVAGTRVSMEEDIPFSEDFVYPISLSMALWQDFALAGINIYNDLSRELSKINEYWLDIFWNVWSESSDSGEKRENK